MLILYEQCFSFFYQNLESLGNSVLLGLLEVVNISAAPDIFERFLHKIQPSNSCEKVTRKFVFLILFYFLDN